MGHAFVREPRSRLDAKLRLAQTFRCFGGRRRVAGFTSARSAIVNMVQNTNELPIRRSQTEILDALKRHRRLVLAAPTGSGKTTQVPQMLLDAGLADRPVARQIVVLQPRRVAARTVAARVAFERGVALGQEVGYQIRFDDQTSLGTRICFVTEGILLRWLQDDRALSHVAAVLFDEFHERNLLSDVALALAKRLQETQRPDLLLAVMSATLETQPLAEYLARRENAEGPLTPCPVVVAEGRLHPIETRYIQFHDERPASEQAADAVAAICAAGDEGDILVFMPGKSEIDSTLNALRSAGIQERLALLPLHGELPPDDQDRAFAAHPVRKVVVATNVAETSVTIDGVRHVVDSGLARVARYDAARGIHTLVVEQISRASADQRQGRAGRTAPGTCHRLWTESGHLNRPERNTPEIQRCDLAEAVLLLHSLGIRRAVAFDWLDHPDDEAVERAEWLLQVLGALESAPGGGVGDLTPVGRQMLRLPLHPRYARMLVEAARWGCVPAAALCAALVSGRDLLVRLGRDDRAVAEARELFEASADSDFYTLMRAYQYAQNRNFATEACRRYGIHAQTARQVAQTRDQILQIAQREGLVQTPAGAENSANDTGTGDPLLRCLLAGFIDQLCVRRDMNSPECDLPEGRTGFLPRESVVQQAPLFVCATLRETAPGRGSRTMLGLASVARFEWIEALFPHLLTTTVEHLYDRTHKRVAAVKLVRLLDLVIHHAHQKETDDAAAGRCLAEAARKEWFELPGFNHEIEQFIARVNLVCAALPELEFPALDEPAIVNCLARAFTGMTLAKEAQAASLREAFAAHLQPAQREWLDELAPKTILWPDGRRLKLAYAKQEAPAGPPEPPELSIKINECFALKEHPRLCEGKVPVKLWLASPDGKRLQATGDWPSFKQREYLALRPTLRVKFPSVAWI